MILYKTVEINGEKIKYEAVINQVVTASGDVRQFSVIVHDPDLAGGRRIAILCEPDKIPKNHVIVATLAVK